MLLTHFSNYQRKTKRGYGLYMTTLSPVMAIAPRTGKIIKNDLGDFERGEHLLQNGIRHFVFTLRQLPEIVLQSWNLDRRKRGLALVQSLQASTIS